MTKAFETSVRVDKVSLRGPGCLILTGPSSCGKGEVAKFLSRVMSIPPYAHLSMGEILRNTVTRARTDKAYALLLANTYQISADANIFDCVDTSEHLTKKVLSYQESMEKFFNKKGMDTFVSQLDWLEFCTFNGFLVPDRWTQDFIAAHIESFPEFREKPFILDGYPRTVSAAKHILEFLRRMDIPVIKVLHLSISRQEMLSRAHKRGRADDDETSLLARYQFYTEQVQPSVDYLKMELGSDAIALVDAHQPVYDDVNGQKILCLEASIRNVVTSSLRALGVARMVVRDLLESPES